MFARSSLRCSLAQFLVLVTIAGAQQCSRQYNLQINQRLNISSINYPGAYPPGSSCRYLLVAPPNHVVHLSCRFEVYPDNCGTESLFISRDGDMQFRDAERYCRMGQITRLSNFQSLALAYYSSNSNTQQRARLSCQATTRPAPCDCGWSFPARIANGVEAAKHEYPSMVALRDLTSNQRVLCGGNIVSDRYIITAAHCTARQPVASRLMALVGEHDLSSNSESIYAAQYPIRSIINHPAYTVTSSGDLNDIALLQTARPMRWSRGVGPICLPARQSGETFAYENVDIAGWGTLGFTAPKSNTLQKATLLTMENRVCEQRYNASIAANQICTYDSRGQGQDSCQYDSGGPVILRQQQRLFLLGVISYGRVCGQRYGIGVNTRITAHLNWLWRYVGGGVCVR
ncbi:venom serine protease [Scaptodrosophila lebanonensis]|uniref:Venom serine protease n=1 Tax=Drosophila lebanonensis TaxID=7225 RepID=A0A6J2T4T8_DROLE|nr:venom serine protease [Scaptodrosophila lebanonensis]